MSFSGALILAHTHASVDLVGSQALGSGSGQLDLLERQLDDVRSVKCDKKDLATLRAQVRPLRRVRVPNRRDGGRRGLTDRRISKVYAERTSERSRYTCDVAIRKRRIWHLIRREVDRAAESDCHARSSSPFVSGQNVFRWWMLDVDILKQVEILDCSISEEPETCS
jgi:hypothetical protein